MRRRVLAAFAAAAVGAGVASTFGVGMALGSRATGSPVVTAAVSCQEDQPCWDWRTMGNRDRGVCIDDVDWLEHADPEAPYDLARRTFTLGGRGCEALNDDSRPVCWVEPANTPEGFEVIWYAHLDDVALGNPGFEVLCP